MSGRHICGSAGCDQGGADSVGVGHCPSRLALSPECARTGRTPVGACLRAPLILPRLSAGWVRPVAREGACAVRGWWGAHCALKTPAALSALSRRQHDDAGPHPPAAGRRAGASSVWTERSSLHAGACAALTKGLISHRHGHFKPKKQE